MKEILVFALLMMACKYSITTMFHTYKVRYKISILTKFNRNIYYLILLGMCYADVKGKSSILKRCKRQMGGCPGLRSGTGRCTGCHNGSGGYPTPRGCTGCSFGGASSSTRRFSANYPVSSPSYDQQYNWWPSYNRWTPSYNQNYNTRITYPWYKYWYGTALGHGNLFAPARNLGTNRRGGWFLPSTHQAHHHYPQ